MFETEEEHVEVRKILQETMVHELKNGKQRCKKKKVNGKPVSRVRGMPHTLQWDDVREKHDIFFQRNKLYLRTTNFSSCG